MRANIVGRGNAGYMDGVRADMALAGVVDVSIFSALFVHETGRCVRAGQRTSAGSSR